MKEVGGGPGDEHRGPKGAGDQVHAQDGEANALEDRSSLAKGCGSSETCVLAKSNLEKDEREAHKSVAYQPGYEESTLNDINNIFEGECAIQTLETSLIWRA